MLDARSLEAAYSAVPVLLGVELTLRDGEILALLGRNGAGKTTLMRALIGLLPTTAGAITLGGQTISGLPPHVIARKGIAYVPQGRGIFPKLTVAENLELGTRSRPDGRADVPEVIFDYFPRLRERLAQQAGTMSGGEQQMLAIGRALAGDPKVLLLDEPSEGVQPSIVHQIGDLLKRVVRETGISVLLVEQNIDLALAAASRGLVMEKGRIVREGSMEEMSDEAVMREFLAV
jgi:urea ABC transporter ATP-binding protein UrtE